MLDKKSHFFFFLAAWFLLPGAVSLHAGEKHPFDSLKIGLSYAVNTNRNDFHNFWKPGPGADGFLETPFYYGDVLLGIRVIHYASREDRIPEFLSIFVYTGWGKTWLLPYELDCFTGFSIGSDQMIFGGDHHLGTKYESEFGIHLNSRLSCPLYGKWRANLSGGYTVIFTKKQIRLTFFSAGISRSIEMPGWLKEFLE